MKELGMKFFTVKKEQYCHWCQTVMFPNEDAVIVFIKVPNPNKIPELNNKYFTPVGHIDCFRKWNDAEIVQKWQNWRRGKILYPEKKRRTKPKEKLGRPAIYRNPVIAARLRGLFNYYKKRNPERALELLAQLENLRKGILPVNLTKRQEKERTNAQNPDNPREQ